MKQLVLVLCWLGVLQSVLLGAYFISISKKRRNYLFLGLMLVMIGVRVAKSTIYMFNPDPHLLVMNVGFAAHAMLGPLFLLYIQTLVHKGFTPKLFAVHFLPAIVVFVFSPYLELNAFWYRGGYSVLLYYTLGYLIAGWYLFLKDSAREKSGKMILFLLITLTIFQLSYFSNYILRLTPYEAGAVVHSLLIYAISFIVLKNNDVFNLEKKKKYNNLNLSKEDTERYTEKILALMETQRPYLSADFTLAKCATLTNIPGHILSYLMSESLKQNFLHFTNSYRIEEAKRMLSDANKQHLSIAGIAFDCGFNTLSSFNTAFKKFTNSTPSEFRKNQSFVKTV